MVDYDRLADIVGALNQEAKLLSPCGVKSGDAHRFINAWGLAVAAIPLAQRPRGAVFVLRVSNDQPSLPEPDVIRDAVMEVTRSQHGGELLILEFEGGIISRLA